jgi:hypothetical protein
VPRGQRDGSLGRNLDFLDRSRYFFFQVAPQLYSTRLSDLRHHLKVAGILIAFVSYGDPYAETGVNKVISSAEGVT